MDLVEFSRELWLNSAGILCPISFSLVFRKACMEKIAQAYENDVVHEERFIN